MFLAPGKLLLNILGLSMVSPECKIQHKAFFRQEVHSLFVMFTSIKFYRKTDCSGQYSEKYYETEGGVVMKPHFRLACFVFFMLCISMLAQAQIPPNLVGWWTFESGEELVDLTGNFDDIVLHEAEVENGKLVLGDGMWANARGYSGPDVTEKTLVAWLIMQGLDLMQGGPLAIDEISIDQFDAIVYGEREPRRWMAGSSFFRRTQDADPGFEEKTTGELIQMAISYEDDGGEAHVRIYRNGDKIGDYTQGPLVTWEAGDTEALFGIRAYIGTTPYGWIDAVVEEARIYNVVLSQNEINGLQVGGEPVDSRGKLATLWGTIKRSR